MKKYKFYNVVFTPDEYHQIKFDGKKVHLSPLQSKLLTYLVESPGKTKERDDILKDVWDGEERHYEVITRTISELKSKLPSTCNFTYVPRKGYAFEHDVIIEQPKFERLERLFAHSPGVKHFLYALLVVISLAITYGFTDLYYGINPPPRHELTNIDTLFTRDYLTRVPQLSPDGRFVAHQLSKEVYVKDYLGLFDAQKGDTTPLFDMSFFDGLEWNLTGDKIVYQDTSTGQCEIRLISFHDDDKTKFSNELLTDCFNTSGSFSFAWYSNNEFYVNFTAKEEITTANRLPQHHLYSFNIDTKERIKLATSEYKEGVGYYSLEYDRYSDTLYFLQTEKFATTRFYSYHNNKLKELAEVDYLVYFFTVDGNRLIYKNNQNQFLINYPADNFNDAQPLLINQPLQIGQPSLKGDQLVYMVGETFHFNLQKLEGDVLTPLALNGFSTYALAKVDNSLVFASAQTGIYQLYKLNSDGELKNISHFKENQLIRDIHAVNNKLVLSTFNKVTLYEFKDEALKQVKVFKGYNRGVLSADGTRVLLTNHKSDDITTIYEKQLDSLFHSNKTIALGRFAFYHQNNIIYLNKDRELVRLINDKESIIATGINTNGIEYTAIDGDDLYYIEQHKTLNKLFKVNLVTGKKMLIDLKNVNPTKVLVLNGQIYIRTKQMRKTLFIKGDLVVH